MNAIFEKEIFRLKLFLYISREYVWDDIVNLRESRNFEFKTGGGAYPIQILPEVGKKIT